MSYDFFDIRNGIQRVEQSLIEQGYLQSRVRLERKVEGRSGAPHVERRARTKDRAAVHGRDRRRRKVQEQVRTQWHRGVFDKQRADDGASMRCVSG